MKIGKYADEELGTLRVIEDDKGILWFFCCDIIKILEYQDENKMVKQYCHNQNYTSKFIEETNIIFAMPESALFRFLGQTNKPNAKYIEEWILKEIIPDMREDESNYKKSSLEKKYIEMNTIKRYKNYLAPLHKLLFFKR